MTPAPAAVVKSTKSAMEHRKMKTLKFEPHLVQLLLNGTKTVTWRLFDDKNLQIGDHLGLVNAETGEKFGEAEIIKSQEKQIKDLTNEDLKGNNYRDQIHVIELNQKYYGNTVDDKTVVKIIEFKLL